MIWQVFNATARSAMVVSCSFTGTMGRNRSIACFVSHFDCFQCFRYRTDLVQFDQDGISCTQVQFLWKVCSVLVTNRSSPTSCTLSPSSCSQLLPAFPVFLIQTIFDGNDRIFVYRVLPSAQSALRKYTQFQPSEVYSSLCLSSLFHSEEAASIAILKSLPGS